LFDSLTRYGLQVSLPRGELGFEFLVFEPGSGQRLTADLIQ
jgi:hypothetical protein